MIFHSPAKLQAFFLFFLRTFATVTKAITKWKLQTRANRALREQQAALGGRRTPNGHIAIAHRRNSKISNGSKFYHDDKNNIINRFFKTKNPQHSRETKNP